MSGDGFDEVVDDDALLQAERLHRRQHALDEPATPFAAAALRPLAPQHRRPTTARRSARSAALSVGSTPAYRTNAPSAGSHSSKPRHSASALAQPHALPRRSKSRSQARWLSM